MKWNEYAKVGEALRKAFWRTPFDRVEPCDFALEILDRLKIERGYRLMAMIGDRDTSLYAVRSGDVRHFSRMKPEEVDETEEFSMWNHISVEHSEMGVWQAFLLARSYCMMPAAGADRYAAKRYVFSTAGLKALKNRGNFDCNAYVGDERIVPSVQMNNDCAVVRYCYWNEWQGLVVSTVYLKFNSHGRLECVDQNDEVLFAYDCGVRYSDVDLSSLWVRRREVGNGVVAVDVVIAPVSGGRYYREIGWSSDEEELKEIEAEAMEWIEDYDDFLRECEADESEFGGGEYGDDDEDYDEEYDEEDGPESEDEVDIGARERYEAAMSQIADKLKEAVRQKEKEERAERAEAKRKDEEERQRRIEERARKEEEKRRAKEEDDRLWAGSLFGDEE